MRTIRPIAISDISETFRVRTATDENRLTSAQLTALGITESSVSEKLLGSYKGWLSRSRARWLVDHCWQLTGSTGGTLDNRRVIALHEIVECDPSTLEPADSAVGWQACARVTRRSAKTRASS